MTVGREIVLDIENPRRESGSSVAERRVKAMRRVY